MSNTEGCLSSAEVVGKVTSLRRRPPPLQQLVDLTAYTQDQSLLKFALLKNLNVEVLRRRP